jgi:hypothetical protein
MPMPSTVPHGDARDQIYGREYELARLDELVDGVAERGAVLLMRGEPGIGKSTLLEAACRRAEETGMRVLSATGVQSEAPLPFAGLHQLAWPMLAQADRLPKPQRSALLTAFGMEEAAEAPDRFLIALAVLELLSDAAQPTSLLVVIEDAHWLDRSSADVLAFVARRVEHERIVVLMASRDNMDSFFDDAGLPEFTLGGLDDAAAKSLLDAHGRQLAPAVRAQLHEQTGGNPLALIELPVLLGTDELGGRFLLPTPLPLTARLERSFGTRAANMPVHTRSLLLLAAIDHGGDLGEILAAGAMIDGEESTIESLTPAVAARLIQLNSTFVAFRHPLRRIPDGDTCRAALRARGVGGDAQRPTRPTGMASCGRAPRARRGRGRWARGDGQAGAQARRDRCRAKRTRTRRRS